MLKLQTLFYQCLDVLRTNSGTSESHIPSVPTKLNELTKNWKYYFLFMCLLYWPLQNAIYQFCQHSSKLLRIQSMDFYIVSKDGVCAQIHLVCILILIFFFPCQVRIFKLLSSLEVNFLGYLQIPPVLQFSCHRSIQLVLIIL